MIDELTRIHIVRHLAMAERRTLTTHEIRKRIGPLGGGRPETLPEALGCLAAMGIITKSGDHEWFLV